MASKEMYREFDAKVLPDFTAQIDGQRKYVDVSDGFCKILGYTREELIGKRCDELTAPRTNNIPVIFELFRRNNYMHGIWVFIHRSRTTLILMRYEAWLGADSRIKCNMELLGAGA
jgi:PAS domain S-box-containing protein